MTKENQVARSVTEVRFVHITSKRRFVLNAKEVKFVSIISLEIDALTVTGLIFASLEKNHIILIVEHKAIEN